MGFEPTTAGITIQKPNQCLCCLQAILGNINRARYLLYITCYFLINRPRLSRLRGGGGAIALLWCDLLHGQRETILLVVDDVKLACKILRLSAQTRESAE